jgi:hypothetical protein
MKKLLITLPLCLLFAFKQNGRIEGVVTYTVNSVVAGKVGSEPDIGAKIWIVAASKCDFNILAIDTFEKSNYYRAIFKLKYQGKKGKIDAELKQNLITYKGYDDGEFNALDKRAYAAVTNVEQKNIGNTVVDGAGKYLFNLPIESYYIFIKSNGRKSSNSIMETSGRIHFERVDLSNISNVSYDFRCLEKYCW